MAVRTTSGVVVKVLGSDYGLLPDGSAPDMDSYIEAASSVVDDLLTESVARGASLTTAKLELIERWLSAHFYTKMDPTYTSKSTAGASASFVRGPKEAEPYKDVAISLDPTGSLNALLNRLTAGGFWLGKTKTEQLDYDQRN